MPGEAAAAFGHDLIMVPSKDGFEQRDKQIHPALRRRDHPFVLDVSRGAHGAQSPAPNSSELSDGDALEQARLLEWRGAHIERKPIRQPARPGVAAHGANASLVAFV